MKIEWRVTGNPWHDWGLVELYKIMCEPELREILNVTAPTKIGFTLFSELQPAEVGEGLARAITRADRWNALHPRFPEGRAIPRCQPRTEHGRRIPGEKYEEKVSVEEWRAADLKGNPPASVRNMCQRLVSVPVTTSQLDELFSQAGGSKSMRAVVDAALAPGEMLDMSQGVNPMVAKHHSNVTVRGPGGSNGPMEAPAQHVLACLCASISAWKPFAKNDDTVVVLPVSLPFDVEVKLWEHLRTSLLDPDGPKGEMYRNIPLRVDGDAAELLALLHAIVSSMAERHVDLFTMEEVRTLRRWVAIHFSSGTNVIVGAIRAMQTGPVLLELLEPIVVKNSQLGEEVDEQQTIGFLKDVFCEIRLDNYPWQEIVADAMLAADLSPTDAWRGLTDCAFALNRCVSQAKKSNRAAARLLAASYYHFARRLINMTPEQLSSCKKIGELVGSAFHRDITLLSRLHNTTSPGDMRSILELISFRLFKASNGPDKSQLWHLSAGEYEELLQISHTPDWQAAAQTISAFASLKAFNINLAEEGKN